MVSHRKPLRLDAVFCDATPWALGEGVHIPLERWYVPTAFHGAISEINPLKTKRNQLYIKICAYRAVNTLNLGYKKRRSC
jgi:hypothetical protein